MILTYLEETRKQPEEVRKRRAMILTIAITGVIVVFYLLTIFLKFESTSQTDDGKVAPVQKNREDVFNAANVFLQESGAQGNSSLRQQ